MKTPVSETPLRPFFSYYGGKWAIAPYYPSPKFDTIIEPFAGSAGYSMRYPNRQVVLYDADPIIVNIWNYLINVDESEILQLPINFKSVNDLNICEPAKHLIGFWIARGKHTPAHTPSAWMRSGKHATSFWSKSKRHRISQQLKFIRHWKCYRYSYKSISNQDATWFIDPPYQGQGSHYAWNHIDYKFLGKWCQKRKGQVIVCESNSANWIQFRPFKEIRGVADGGKRRSMELIWTKG